MPWRRHHYGLKFWQWMIILCVLAALAALAVTKFLESFSSYAPQYYTPFEDRREEIIKKKEEAIKKKGEKPSGP